MKNHRLSSAILLALLCAGAAHAQMSNLSGSNRLEVWVEDSLRATSYLNQFDLEYSNESWLIGARLELDEEPWWDEEQAEQSEIVRRYAEYRDDNLTARAGNFYATFGRGLVLRTMEDEDVRVDRNIDGLYGNVNWRRLAGQAILGRVRNDRDSARPNVLAGADLDFMLHQSLRMGGAYVRRDAQGSPEGEDFAKLGRPATEEVAGARAHFMRGIADLYIEGARLMRRGENSAHSGWTWSSAEDGYAWYGAMNMAVPGYAAVIEGKRYLRFKDKAEEAPFWALPSCNYDGQMINDAEDEVGFGLVLTASPTDDITGELRGSWADAEDDAIPSERSAASGSIRKDWWGTGALKLGGEWTDEHETAGYVDRIHAGPTWEASWYMGPTTSVTLHGSYFTWEVEKAASKGGAAHRDEYSEITADVTLGFEHGRAVTVALIKASDPVHEYGGDDLWITGELAWAFGYNHELKIKVGEERGGLVCSGGICRVETPFTGVRAEFVSRF